MLARDTKNDASVLEDVCVWWWWWVVGGGRGYPAAICPHQRFLDRRDDRLVDEVVVTSGATVGLAATARNVAAGRHRRVKVNHGDLARSHNSLKKFALRVCQMTTSDYR